MKRTLPILIATLVIAACCAGRCLAEEPDAGVIKTITGLAPEVKGGVAKVTVPRTDLSVVVDGVKMTPFQGLTSWAAFERAGDKTMVMGDLTLTEAQVNLAMSAALDSGLEVTALHNHFLYVSPPVFYMHIGGMGTTEQLATAVRKTLDAASAASGPDKDGFAGPKVPEKSSIDAKPLESILRSTAQEKDGMVKFVFAKKTAMHGVEAGAGMGVNTWAVFTGSDEACVVDGDFAMLEGELQGVLRALRGARINVVAIHNHMTHEEPRIVFLHYWGKGRAADLARGIAAARTTQHDD